MPFDPATITAPFRMQPGLTRLAAGQKQLTPSRPGDAVLAAKLAVLRDHRQQALCRVADFDDRPALTALADQAALEHPQAWKKTGGGPSAARHDAPLIGWSLCDGEIEGSGDPAIGECLRSLPAEWRLAGLLSLAFAEDFALIDGSAGAAGRIPWLAVCLPSRWAPEDKLGRSFAAVHAPVADNDQLLRAAAVLPQMVCAEQRWQRFVWTITRSALLDRHPRRQVEPPWSASDNAEQLAAGAWLRSEHQTFIPIAGQKQAIFTIHTELRRLTEVAGDPLLGEQTCRALFAALASMSPAVLEYRGLDKARDRLLDWLSSQKRECAV